MILKIVFEKNRMLVISNTISLKFGLRGKFSSMDNNTHIPPGNQLILVIGLTETPFYYTIIYMLSSGPSYDGYQLQNGILLFLSRISNKNPQCPTGLLWGGGEDWN